MRIPSGVTDQYIYFVAVDATDFTTRETGLASFTVYRSRDGGAAAAMTTPTINEVDATNMPGVYELLLDEDMTIAAGNDSEEMCFHITHAGMHPVTRTIELYRPKITAGETLTVSSSIIPWPAAWDAEVQSECADALTAYDPPTNAEMEARTLVAANYATAAALATVDGNVDLILEDTGTTLPATLATISGYIDTEIAGIISTLGAPAGISISADIAALPTAAENRAEIDSNSTQLAAIVADTNELQTNQGNWLTATGFSTHSAADVWSVPTRVLTANTNLNDPTAAQIRAEIDSNSTQLVAILSGVITGQAQTGTLSTTQATTNLSGYADDQLIGRVIVWTSGNCDGEATDITDYSSASGLLTFTALTTAPANGDTFKIV